MNTPIYELIKKALVNEELPRGFSIFQQKEDIMFADGAKDGIRFYHMGPQIMNGHDYQVMCEAIDAVNKKNPDLADKLFIDLSEKIDAISIVDKLQGYVFDIKETLDATTIYDYCVRLITSSANAECIKYALSILELMNTDDDETKSIIKTLALSDEFTFFCIYIMKKWPDGNQEIFDTAKKVYGWGRIFAVKELRALDPYYDEIRKWLLEEGIDNDVMRAYSALDVWRNGNVGSTLYTHPTPKQLAYIRDIIDALLDEGPVIGISALDKKEEIVMVFLNELNRIPLSQADYDVIENICDYFKDKETAKEIICLAEKILEKQ